MISNELIRNLHCPYCGSDFRVDLQAPPLEEAGVRNGILRCACYRYPIVDGILILRQRSGPVDTFDNAVAHLEAGDIESALHESFHAASPVQAPKTRWRKLLARLGSSHNDRASLSLDRLTFRQALDRYRPSGYAHYLFYRYANNSFLAAIPLLLLLRTLRSQRPSLAQPVRLLDLNCGVGHATFLARLLFPEMLVIPTDHDFANLYLAKRFLVRESACLCLDAELPLPFADNFFDAAVCIDGLHYVRSKTALIEELDRSTKEDGLLLFPHLHNALAANLSAGVPLAPKEYERCFQFAPLKLCSETQILLDFAERQMLDLTSRSGEEISTAPVLSIVASRSPQIWRRHEDLAADLLKINANWIVNPIYAHREGIDDVKLQMAWPNPALERECEPAKRVLRSECTLPLSQWARLKNGAALENTQAFADLVKSFTIVPLPMDCQ